MAAVLVAARFCEPSSELHIAEYWYRRTALCDLLQLGDEEVNKDRLYRGPHQAGRRRLDCLAGHVRLELRNVVAKYPFERSLRFPGIQQNSDHRDYSPLSCGVGWTQLGPRTQGITEETATPWGRPESFSIEGARRLRSSGAPPDV